MSAPLTPPLCLRPFAAVDAAAVAPWLAGPGLSLPPGSAARDWGHRLVADPRVAAWMVEQEGAACGFLRLDIGPDRIAELTIVVAPLHRRQGIGSRALGRLVEEARRLGLHRLQAMVEPAHTEAMEFFVEQGFEAAGGHVAGRVRLDLLLHAARGDSPLEIVP